MTLIPATRSSAEDYASADDLLTCSDRAQADVRVPLWTKGGKPLLLRVQAPSQADEEAAHLMARAALIAAHKRVGLPSPGSDEEDWSTLVLETIQRCIVAPRLTRAQAEKLREKNPIALDQLYAFIVGLRGFTPEGLADFLAQYADLPPGGAEGEAATDEQGADDRPLGTSDSD